MTEVDTDRLTRRGHNLSEGITLAPGDGLSAVLHLL